MLDKYKENKNIILLPIMALMSFTTWVLKIDEVINILIYLIAFSVLVYLKVDFITLVMFALFGVMAQNQPNFLNFLSDIFSKVFHKESGIKTHSRSLYSILISLVILIGIIKMVKNKRYPIGKLVIPLTLMVGYSFITLIWAPNFAKGISEISFFIQGYIVYILIRNIDDRKVSFNEISWFLTMIVLVISLQYLVVYIKYPGDGKMPLFNLWANPNIVASVFGIAYIPSLYKYFDKNRSLKTFLYLPFEILALYAIIMSKSNGLYLGFIAGIVCIPLIFVKNKKTIQVIVGLGILAFISFIFIVVKLEHQMPSLYDKVNKLSTSRIDIYKIAINQLSKPLVFIFGRGLGADRIILVNLNVSFFHSWFFQIFVNRGLIGIVIIGFILYHISNIVLSSKASYKPFLLIGFIVYLAHGITDCGFEYQYMGVMFYLLIAFAEKDQMIDNSKLVINNNESGLVS